MKRMGSGFTIVELLIVIVVIAILAAISIAAYTNVSNRANDAAIRNDLSNIARKIELYKVENDALPAATPEALKALKLPVSKSIYGDGYVDGAGRKYNLLYCRSSDGTQFTLVAWSKNANGFAYAGSGIMVFDDAPAPKVTTCPRLGMSSNGNEVWWLYNNGWEI